MRRTLPLLTAGLALAPTADAFAGAFTPERGGSPNADNIAELYNLIGVLAIIVFVTVLGALLWATFKYKARKGAVAAQIHGNTRLEIGWTVAAAAILVFLVVFTFIKLPEIKNPAPSGKNGLQFASSALYASTDQPSPPDGKALRIVVDGQQYVWRYQYPKPDKPASVDTQQDAVFSYEEMVVPSDTTVVLDITADDVVHSWWIPRLGGKMDAVPGYTNHTWFKAKPGIYRGQCAELCGRGHANMLAQVRVVSPAEYEQWYEDKAQQISDAREQQQDKRPQYDSGATSPTSEADNDQVTSR